MDTNARAAQPAPLSIAVPGRGTVTLGHLVLDLNGILALDGQVLAGVAERLDRLRASLTLHVLTAGTHGQLDAAGRALGLDLIQVGTGAEKAVYVRSLGAAQVVAMGNGANDAPMFREAALAIAVLGGEGLAGEALRAADVVVPDAGAGLDLLLMPARLVATLRP